MTCQVLALPIAHERAQRQTKLLEQSEKENTLLRARLALLEGTSYPDNGRKLITEVEGVLDDLSITVRTSIALYIGRTLLNCWIKLYASNLERQIARWSSKVARSLPNDLLKLHEAIYSDLSIETNEPRSLPPTPMEAVYSLRNVIAELINDVCHWGGTPYPRL